MEILYIKGDATAPIGSGVKVITHICNDIGGWEKGLYWHFLKNGKCRKKPIASGTNHRKNLLWELYSL